MSTTGRTVLLTGLKYYVQYTKLMVEVVYDGTGKLYQQQTYLNKNKHLPTQNNNDDEVKRSLTVELGMEGVGCVDPFYLKGFNQCNFFNPICGHFIFYEGCINGRNNCNRF